MNTRLFESITGAISALSRHGYTEASACLQIELALYRRGKVEASRLRQTANQLLSILA